MCEGPPAIQRWTIRLAFGAKWGRPGKGGQGTEVLVAEEASEEESATIEASAKEPIPANDRDRKVRRARTVQSSSELAIFILTGLREPEQLDHLEQLADEIHGSTAYTIRVLRIVRAFFHMHRDKLQHH